MRIVNGELSTLNCEQKNMGLQTDYIVRIRTASGSPQESSLLCTKSRGISPRAV